MNCVRQTLAVLGRRAVRMYSTSNVPTARYVPRRAMMYVPASDEKKLAKVSSLEADCVVLDCEDGVAVTRKQEARANCKRFLDGSDAKAKNQAEIGIRVNSVSSGLLEEDLRVISQAHVPPQAIMLPKVDDIHCLEVFSQLFKASFKLDHMRDPVRLVIWIESARALVSMPDILKAATNLRHHLPLLTDAVVFGSDDFCADIGATRTSQAGELIYARQKFVTVCKAFKLQAIDIVYIDYKDIAGLKAQSIEANGMGFTGKQVIHPSQVPIVQQAFLPAPEKVQWAKQLLAEFAQHEQSGKGAFTFRGSMIDMPLVLQARNIVQTAQRSTIPT